MTDKERLKEYDQATTDYLLLPPGDPRGNEVRARVVLLDAQLRRDGLLPPLKRSQG